MNKNGFVEYLNTLHNLNANNQNAYTETNTTNEYFHKTMVTREVGNYIIDSLEKESPHILILTGHAGDGKTGLLYQTLLHWKALTPLEHIDGTGKFSLPNGKICSYIKDFSEIEQEKRLKLLNEKCNEVDNGQFVFLVANTGPLISSFIEILTEAAYRKFIDAIDKNDGQIQSYDRKDNRKIEIAVINVATVDNSIFIEPFLTNVLVDENWNTCALCEKRSICPIINNREYVYKYFNQVVDFIVNHYVWQQEHGKKLTIRQIVAHLSFMLTGGKECHQIRNSSSAKFSYLFSNLFFGYEGVKQKKDALRIRAISDIVENHYDEKRIRADEKLFIREETLFEEEIDQMLRTLGNSRHFDEEWQKAVRRAYIMLRNDTDGQSTEKLYQDVFSVKYPRFLQLRNDEQAKIKAQDRNLILDALQMLFTGVIERDKKEIDITMKSDENLSQNVQIVYQSLDSRNIKIDKEQINDYCKKKRKRYQLYIKINETKLETKISLPMINYFEDIRNGIIPTNIDPQLSQGINSLMAQIIACCAKDKEVIDLRTMNTNGWTTLSVEYDDEVWKIR